MTPEESLALAKRVWSKAGEREHTLIREAGYVIVETPLTEAESYSVETFDPNAHFETARLTFRLGIIRNTNGTSFYTVQFNGQHIANLGVYVPPRNLDPRERRPR